MKISGKLVEVTGRKIRPVNMFVENGRIQKIVHCDNLPESTPFIIPGLIDAHVHIESTLLLPTEYAKMAVRHGVVGCIADPHEIANVCGVEGVEFMIENGEKADFHFKWAASPCVPSTTFETTGAELNSDDILKILQKKEVYGLGEMMNVPGVLFSDEETMKKIAHARSLGKVVDGHCPSLSGEDLQKYIDAGVQTDHESSTLKEGREKVARGMKVIVREGSAARNLEAIGGLIGEASDNVMLCSDDMYPDELYDDYIDGMVRYAVGKGMDVFDVLKTAGVNPVNFYKMPVGLLREGDSADFVLVDNLKDFHVRSTFISGKEVYSATQEEKAACGEGCMENGEFPNRFNACKIDSQALKVVCPENVSIKVMTASDGTLYTGINIEKPLLENGYAVSDVSRDILKIIVYDRYSPDAKPAIGFIRGFGLRKGAMGSTIAHDSHNIVVVGTSDSDIAAVIGKIVEMRGGIAVYDGNRMQSLPLPVAGLISPEKWEKVVEDFKPLKSLAREIGCPFSAPFMTLAFMALPVIPELKLTDKGLFDYASFAPTTLFTD